MEDCIANFIQFKDSDEQDGEHENKESLSHLATVESDEEPAAFTIGLQEVPFFHAATA